MLATQGFIAILILALNNLSSCGADRHLPAPTGLQFRWLNNFTLETSWSWSRPDDLNCTVDFSLTELGREAEKGKTFRCAGLKCKEKFLMHPNSNQWELEVKALGNQCTGWTDSEPSRKIIHTLKPYAELVKDFTCVIQPDILDCSWIPVDPSQGLNLSFWYCGGPTDHEPCLHKCDNIHVQHGRGSCVLKLEDGLKTIYVAVETEYGMNTFETKPVTDLPNWSITEGDDEFNLTWHPTVGKNCIWTYNVQYKECNEEKYRSPTNEPFIIIPRNKCCKYEFRFNATSNSISCEKSSGNSEVRRFEAQKFCNTTTIITIIVPIIIFICMILSLYCFRRNRSILCPDVTDIPASYIFKEMMSGNSKKTAPVPLYTPVPEQFESTNITLLPKRIIS